MMNEMVKASNDDEEDVDADVNDDDDGNYDVHHHY